MKLLWIFFHETIFFLNSNPVTKLPFLIRYVPYQYKTQQICYKAVIENGGLLKSVPYQYQTQEMFNKSVHSYAHALEFVPECYETQEICDKAVNACFSNTIYSSSI